MEYVGRRVKKVLEGLGTVLGLVRGYEQTTGFCKIAYDGGESEELHLSEVTLLLVPAGGEPSGAANKRRRVGNGGEGDDNFVIGSDVRGDLVGRKDGCGGLDLNLNRGFNLNEAVNCLDDDDDHGGNAAGVGAKLLELDLNQPVAMEVDEGLCLKGQVEERPGVKKEMIDLNLDVNEDVESLGGGREVRSFDLNLRFTEDEERNLDECEGQFGGDERVCDEGDRVELGEDGSVGDLRNLDGEKGNVVNVEKKGDNLLKNSETTVGNKDLSRQSVQRKIRGGKRKDTSSYDNELPAAELPKEDLEAGGVKLELESGQGASLQNGIDCDVRSSEVVVRGRRAGKRKELTENDVVPPTLETRLRRSNRRAKRAAVSGSDQVSDAPRLDGINNQFSSPSISGVSDEKIMVADHGKSASCAVLPPKVELPPSSCNLDLNGVSVFDFVSVYAFLRSFSTLLFLSPFGFNDFVMSVKSDDSTLLFDSIHVSLLRMLRKHLESLSDEGSVSASDCLRSVNWDFLDLITWPVFVVKYLFLHRPDYIPGLDVCQLKHFQTGYYRQPVSTKVDILRHLCDDITEMEAFKSEINRRVVATNRPTAVESNVKSRKRKAVMDVASISCITDEDAVDPADGNSDECCLCRMDGNLICCDGCPAAFHSRCVGVISSMLPEGDWYCPECAIEKDKPWMRLRKSIRGAELLGIDPYQRAYYNSCGFLLILESGNDDYSSWFYNRNDLVTLIEALESSPFIYDTIINAICKQWNIVRGVGGAKNDLDDHSYSVQSAFPENRQLVAMHPAPSETLNNNEAFADKRCRTKSMASATFNYTEPENLGQGTALVETENQGVRLQNCFTSSEGSAEVSQTSIKMDTSNENGRACSEKCPDIPDHFHSPEKPVNSEAHYMTPTSVNAQKGEISLENSGCATHTINSGGVPQVHYGANYINCYEFARTASSYFEESTCKSSDKSSEDAEKSDEEMIGGQLKFVLNRFAEFSWSNIQTLNMNCRRERCGWCFYCRDPEDERDCLFIMNDSIPAVENYTCNGLGIRSRKNSKNHLVDVKCHIICIENHLHGLLSGPWLNPQYSMLWCESVLGANDIGSLKNLLIEVELNMHQRALSAEWRKHVDSAVTMGSAYHFVSSSARASLKHGIVRKRANTSKVENASSPNAAAGVRLLWWRGGRVSRRLFNWKVLPRSLASKAARQGGRNKIPGVLYPESGEYAKRIKYVSWRAAVETSRSVEQLALQVRELDANIRWDDIGNNSLLSKMGKEAKTSVRSFKKVIIRRKCSEGAVVKYLLDFGKRRFIPDVVVIHGSMLEDSSNARRKYWLEESHVPLYLLKAFEEKKIARKSDMGNPGKLGESSGVILKPFRNEGFSYLFSRAERSENCLCGHCKKDVLTREAVSCQHCQGLFHKKHARRSAESNRAECTYTCHKCLGGKFVKVDARKRKSEFPKDKNASKGLKPLRSGKRKRRGKGKPALHSKKTRPVIVVPLRRSARNTERIANFALLKNKVKKCKTCKKDKSEKGMFKKNSIQKKKRTPLNSSFWLNGIRLSRKPTDERSMQFRSRMLLVLSGEAILIRNEPKCSLCKELEYESELNYVACEICGVWFHGDALNLTADKIANIIGFKCHICLDKRPPLCPHHFPIGSNKAGVVSENDLEIACTEDILPSNGYDKVGEDKGQELNAVETEFTTHNSDMVQEAACSALMHNFVNNDLTNNCVVLESGADRAPSD